jgi:hypothetical protein
MSSVIRRGAALVGLCALLGAAACGNYGNVALDDAPFLNALPHSEYLRYDVPSGAGSPLCQLGESKVAADTRTLGGSLAVGVVSILAVIDAVRTIPPTTRDQGVRVWGPFPDGQHPGAWVRATMTRVAASPPQFTFTVEERQGQTGPSVATLTAELTGAQARTGQGALHFDFAAAAQVGVNKPTDPTVGRLDVDYDLTSDPRTIHITSVGVPNPADVTVVSWLDGQARLDLVYTDDKGTSIHATSKFMPDGTGAAKWSVTSGIFGDTVKECWTPLYCRTYLKDPANWLKLCPGAFCELGNLSSCDADLHGGPFDP